MMHKSSLYKRIALVVLTQQGLQLAFRLQRGLAAEAHIYVSQRVLQSLDAQKEGNQQMQAVIGFEKLRSLLAELWKTYDQMILFFALGAAIRLLAPLLHDKHVDPGVVVIDDAGKFVISAVSGHPGGANSLAQQCAGLLGAIPVITTASDVQHTFALDMLAQQHGWQIEDRSALTAVTAALVNREPVALLQDAGELHWWNEDEYVWPDNLLRVKSPQEVTAGRFSALIVLADRLLPALPITLPTLVYRPPTLVLGIGCQRGISFDDLHSFVRETLVAHRIAWQSIVILTTADIKADEKALQELACRYHWCLETHTVDALGTVPHLPHPSERVRQLIGIPGVCEAAALLSSQGGELLVEKQRGKGMTLAVARRRCER